MQACRIPQQLAWSSQQEPVSIFAVKWAFTGGPGVTHHFESVSSPVKWTHVMVAFCSKGIKPCNWFLEHWSHFTKRFVSFFSWFFNKFIPVYYWKPAIHLEIRVKSAVVVIPLWVCWFSEHFLALVFIFDQIIHGYHLKSKLCYKFINEKLVFALLPFTSQFCSLARSLGATIFSSWSYFFCNLTSYSWIICLHSICQFFRFSHCLLTSWCGRCGFGPYMFSLRSPPLLFQCHPNSLFWLNHCEVFTLIYLSVYLTITTFTFFHDIL